MVISRVICSSEHLHDWLFGYAAWGEKNEYNTSPSLPRSIGSGVNAA